MAFRKVVQLPRMTRALELTSILSLFYLVCTCSTDYYSQHQLSQVGKVHVNQVVRLEVLIAKVHQHPEQGHVHILLGVFLALLVHSQALHVWILHPSFAQSNCREDIILHAG